MYISRFKWEKKHVFKMVSDFGSPLYLICLQDANYWPGKGSLLAGNSFLTNLNSSLLFCFLCGTCMFDGSALPSNCTVTTLQFLPFISQILSPDTRQLKWHLKHFSLFFWNKNWSHLCSDFRCSVLPEQPVKKKNPCLHEQTRITWLH